MTLPRAVYDFAIALEAAAGIDAALKDAIVHFHRKQEMNQTGGTKFIRIGGLLSSKPMPIGSGALKEFNAVIDVTFVQIPEDQTVEKQFEAQATVDQMANEFIAAVIADRTLGTNNCDIIGQVSWEKAADFIKPANVNMPLSAIRLTINPDENIRR